MLVQYWKRIGIIIVVILCLINGISKLTKVISFENTLEAIKSKIIIIEKIKENK